MFEKRTRISNLFRTVLAFALAYLMVWGLIPTAALAQMGEEAVAEERAIEIANTKAAEGSSDEGTARDGEAEPVPPIIATEELEETVTDEEKHITAQSDGEGIEVTSEPNAGAVLPAQGISVTNPRVVEDSSTHAGQVTTWDCIWFGSYPQTEVKETDPAYESVQSAEWDSIENEAVVDGVRYKRVKSESTSWRYFRFDPVKWRVLHVADDTALVLADKALEYMKIGGDRWNTSSLRRWLQLDGLAWASEKGFTAFSAEELAAISWTTHPLNYGEDRVFILAKEDVCGDGAKEYGFAGGSDPYYGKDETRMCEPTDYCGACGTSVYEGNCEWLLRTHDGGYCFFSVNERGLISSHHKLQPCGVRPALNLDLSSLCVYGAGTVSSDGAVEEVAPPLQITSLEIADPSCVYDGTGKEPDVVVRANDAVVPASGYDISYANNVSAGTATVTVVGKGGYKGKKTAEFQISPRSVTVAADDQSKVLGDTDPQLSATVEGVVGGEAVEYELSREAGEELGEYTITASGEAEQGNYVVEFVSGTFTIASQADIARSKVVRIPAQIYAGKALEPAVSVSMDGNELVLGKDYEVSYSNNSNVGTATAIVSGKGAYEGTKTVGFRIVPKGVTVTADSKSKGFGEADPALTAQVAGVIGTDTIDFALSRTPGEELGEYEIIPSGDTNQGNYAVTFVRGALTVVRRSIDSAEVVLENSPYEYYGRPTTPIPLVRIDGIALVPDEDYTVEYANNDKPGIGLVTVHGCGNYDGSKSAEFEIREPARQGMWGECWWVVRSDGTLEVFPGNGADTGGRSPWVGFADSIRRVEFVSDDRGRVVAPSDCSNLLAGLSSLESVDLTSVDFQHAMDFTGMFADCESLSTITFPSLVFSGNVTSMAGMFSGCSGLESLDLSPLDSKSVTTMERMFSGCSRLSSLKVQGLDTRLVEDMSSMFEGCGSLKSLSLYTFNTPKLSDAARLFAGCGALESLDIFGLWTSASTNVSGMFEGCNSVTSFRTGVHGAKLEALPAYKLTGHTDWYSDSDQRWYSAQQIVNDRAGVSDLYTKPTRWINGITESHGSGAFVVGAGGLEAYHLGDWTYTGGPIEPRLTLLYPNENPWGITYSDLVDGVAYERSYENNVEVGNASLIFTFKNALMGRLRTSFEIVPADVATATIAAIADQRYTGSALTPAPTVKLGGRTLVMGTDYDVVYKDNADPGTATVIVKGKGNYTGTKSATFKIEPISITELSLTPTSYVYDGKAKTPAVMVKAGLLSVPASGYSVSYANNTNAGTATVTVTGKGNYTGAKSATFRISPAVITSGSVSPTSYVYDGKAKTPAVMVKAGLLSVPASGYSVSYANNTNAGTATVTITGRGNYTGAKSATFRISPAAITSVSVSPASYSYDGSAKRPGVTVKAGNATVPASGYSVSYANNVDPGTATVTVTGKGNYTGTKSATFAISAPAAAHVAYRTHVQSFGWQPYVRDGAMSGTSGKAKRLEGINIKLEGAHLPGSIEYRTHVQRIGWQGYMRDGAMSGTSGRALRLEAIQIRLTGQMAERYDVWYRVHAQTYGWMGWAKNDSPAGTAGYAKRLEGIEVRVLPKGSAAPGSQSGAFVTKDGSSPAQSYAGHQVSYRTHVQSFGWRSYVCDGQMSGTTGLAKRLEGINIKLINQQVPGSIEYRTHVQSYGWMPYVRDGAMSGTSGQAKRLEAIQIRLTGQMAQRYDVWYRVHAQTFGWMGWAKNDQQAGTAGWAKRLECLEIVVLPKGSPAPGSTANAFRRR